LHVSATVIFKRFAIAHVDSVTKPLWRCLDSSKQLNATSQVWRLIQFYALARNDLYITILLPSPYSSLFPTSLHCWQRCWWFVASWF